MTQRKWLTIHGKHGIGPRLIIDRMHLKQHYVCSCGEVWYVP